MLSEDQVKLLRDAFGHVRGKTARGAAWILSVVLEEGPKLVSPTPAPIPAPEAPAEKTPEQRQIEDLQAALMATRERAEKAEQKYVELKRNGG